MVSPGAGRVNGQTNLSYIEEEEGEDVAGRNPVLTQHNSRRASHMSSHEVRHHKGKNATVLPNDSTTDHHRHMKLLERYLKTHEKSATLKLAVANLHTLPFAIPPQPGQEKLTSKPEKKRKWGAIFRYMALLHKKSGLRHIFLVVLLIGYALLGGAIFQAIEGPNEIEVLREAYEELQYRMGNISEEIISIVRASNGTNTRAEVESVVIEFYKNMLDMEGKMANSILYKIDSDHLLWDFGSAVFYAFTLFTSIGYGTIACATAWGRAVSVIYSIIGIPLMLVVLSDIGRMLFFALQKLYNRVYQWCRRTGLCRKFDKSDTVVEHSFPLRLAFPLLFIYMLICAVLINVIDSALGKGGDGGLSFGDAFYFSFISLSTIGLGDVMPYNFPHSPFDAALFLFGLALLSVINSTIYARMERNYFRAMEAMEEMLEDMHAEEANEHGGGHEVFRNMSSAIRMATVAMPSVEEKGSKTVWTEGLGNIDTTPPYPSTSAQPQSDENDLDAAAMPMLGAFGINLGIVRKLRELNEAEELAKSSLSNYRKLSRSDTNLFSADPRRLSLISCRSL